MNKRHLIYYGVTGLLIVLILVGLFAEISSCNIDYLNGVDAGLNFCSIVIFPGYLLAVTWLGYGIALIARYIQYKKNKKDLLKGWKFFAYALMCIVILHILLFFIVVKTGGLVSLLP